MHECSALFVSRPTLELLTAPSINSDLNPTPEACFGRRHIHVLDFEAQALAGKYIHDTNPTKYYDKITLYQSHHMLGSSQVLVVTSDGIRAAYSNDFAIPQASPLKCDALVIDATHGGPMFNSPVDAVNLKDMFVEYVKEEVEAGRSVCIRAHMSRLQHTMHLLSKTLAPNIRFMSAPDNRRLVRVYAKYGMPIRDVVPSGTWRAEKIVEGSSPFVEFKTTSECKSDHEVEKKSVVFNLEDVKIGHTTMIRQNVDNPNHYFVELGEHVMYSNILEYIKNCSPGVVITYATRSGWGEHLARKIDDALGTDMIAQSVSKAMTA